MSEEVLVAGLVGAAVVVAALAAGYSGSARSARSSVTPLPVVVVRPRRLQGVRLAGLHHRVGSPAAGRDPAPDACRSRARSSGRSSRRAGRPARYKIGYQSCDDSTAQTGGWDTAKCATNARLYANNKSVIGVIGTFNSGCAKIEVPTLNRAHPGPLAMVSPANTNPGLTKKWDPGEPQKYYPTGVAQLRPRRRNRRLPGPGRRDLVEVARLQEGVRPERQADVRLRRRHDVQERLRRSSASRSSASRAGTRSSRATRRSPTRSRRRARRPCSSAASRATTARS